MYLFRRALISLLTAFVLQSLWAGFAQAQAEVIYLNQGWDDSTRNTFYFTPQGSRMFPAEWFVALEKADGSGLFASPENLTRYGLIYAQSDSKLNPFKLPAGFAIDPNPDTETGDYIGLTCAACHTANIKVKEKTIRVDGAPAKFDFDVFYQEFVAAVSHTYSNPDAFTAFSKRVLPNSSDPDSQKLRKQLAVWQSRLASDAVIRHASVKSGFGRVDAFTQILNAMSVVAQKDPSNLRPVEAPVSYPQLWLSPQLEFVQWNPIAANTIGRNVGQVLGVFASVSLTGEPQDWFKSSILIPQLHQLEQMVDQLKPPTWNENLFGSINEKLAARGKQLFSAHCAGCHNQAPYKRTDADENLFGKSFIKIGRVDYKKVGTDPAYVDKLLARTIRTNSVTQSREPGKKSSQREEVVPAFTYFMNTLGPIIHRAMDELNIDEKQRAAMGGYKLKKPATPNGQPQRYQTPSFTDIKAGPLAGIWATGPFLHNGSVPSVFELLSPVSERQKIFWTGGQELDAKKMGFKSEQAPGLFKFDTSIPGNLNTGHEYPKKGLSKKERYAVIEYLKTLK